MYFQVPSPNPDGIDDGGRWRESLSTPSVTYHDFIRAVYRVEWMHGYSIRLLMYLARCIPPYPHTIISTRFNINIHISGLSGNHTSPPPHFTPGNPLNSFPGLRSCGLIFIKPDSTTQLWEPAQHILHIRCAPKYPVID